MVQIIDIIINKIFQEIVRIHLIISGIIVREENLNIKILNFNIKVVTIKKIDIVEIDLTVIKIVVIIFIEKLKILIINVKENKDKVMVEIIEVKNIKVVVYKNVIEDMDVFTNEKEIVFVEGIGFLLVVLEMVGID